MRLSTWIVRSLTVIVLLSASVKAQPGWPQSWGSESCPPVVTVGTSDLELTLTDSGQGHSITAITSSTAGTATFEETPLWTLTLNDGTGTTVLTPGDFPDVHVVVTPSGSFFQWKDQSVVPGNLKVSARIQCNDGAFDFEIQVVNPGLGYALHQVNYPRFSAAPINPIPFSDILVLPLVGGAVNPDPRNSAPTLFPNPGSSMQLFSIFDRLGGGQIYWQTKDGVGWRKDYLLIGQGTSTRFELIQYPEDNQQAGSDYSSPYCLTLTFMEGNWFDAARRYRTWALQQRWAGRGLIETAPDFSPRMRQLKLHALMYPDHLIGFDDFTSLVADAYRVKTQTGLGDDEMMLLWSDWHDNIFNIGLPDFCPPRSSVDAGLAAAHSVGIAVHPYVNVGYWSPSSSAYAFYHAGDYAWTLMDGTVPVILLGPIPSLFFDPHVRLNPAHQGARDARLGVVSDVLSCVGPERWDGLYLDTWAADVPELDYNPALNPEGGTALSKLGQIIEGQGMQSLVKGENPDGSIMSEFMQETMIDSVELVNYNPLSFGGFQLVQLPVWETVYHGYVLTSNLSATVPQPSPLQVVFTFPVLSYDYHLGKVMGISNFFADSRPFIDPDPGSNSGIEIFDYLHALLAVDEHARKYRVFGERLRPLNSSISRSLETLEYIFLGPPSVSTSIWKAEDGDIGILVTNHGPGLDGVALDVDFDTYGLTGTQNLFFNASGTRVLLGQFSSSFSLPLPIDGLGAALLELVADTP